MKESEILALTREYVAAVKAADVRARAFQEHSSALLIQVCFELAGINWG